MVALLSDYGPSNTATVKRTELRSVGNRVAFFVVYPLRLIREPKNRVRQQLNIENDSVL